MNEESWHQRWKSNEIGFNQPQPNELLQRYFGQLNLKPNSRVFVPLCGKSIDMLWLSNQGYDVVGVELSPIACEAFFNENHISTTVKKIADFTIFQSDKITLFSGDFFKLNHLLLGKIEAFYDRAALIALPKILRQRYAQHIIELLGPSTMIFLITTSYNQNEMQGPPFSVDEQEITSLYGSQLNIKQLYNKLTRSIPAHLQAKGLTQASEQIYCLSKISL